MINVSVHNLFSLFPSGSENQLIKVLKSNLEHVRLHPEGLMVWWCFALETKIDAL